MLPQWRVFPPVGKWLDLENESKKNIFQKNKLLYFICSMSYFDLAQVVLCNIKADFELSI